MLDEGARVAFLAAPESADEAMQLLLSRATALIRLVLERAEDRQLDSRADVELALAGGCRVFDRHGRDSRAGWPATQPDQHPLDDVRLSFDLGLDASVGAVADPAATPSRSASATAE